MAPLYAATTTTTSRQQDPPAQNSNLEEQVEQLQNEKRKIETEFQDFRLKHYKSQDDLEHQIAQLLKEKTALQEKRKDAAAGEDNNNNNNKISQTSSSSSSSTEEQNDVSMMNVQEQIQRLLNEQKKRVEELNQEKLQLKNEIQDFRMKQYKTEQDYERKIKVLKEQQHNVEYNQELCDDNIKQNAVGGLFDKENKQQQEKAQLLTVQLQQENKELKETITSLQQQLQTSQEELLSVQTKDRQELEEQYQQAQVDLSSRTAEWKDRYESEQATLRDVRNEAQRQLQELRVKHIKALEALREQLARQREDELRKFKTEGYDKEEAISEMQAELIKLRKENKAQKSSVEQMSKERSSLRGLFRCARQVVANRVNRLIRRKRGTTMVTTVNLNDK